MKIIWNKIVSSKNSDQDLSIEGLNILVEIIEVGYLALQTKTSEQGLVLRSIVTAENEDILKYDENAYV